MFIPALSLFEGSECVCVCVHLLGCIVLHAYDVQVCESMCVRGSSDQPEETN